MTKNELSLTIALLVFRISLSILKLIKFRLILESSERDLVSKVKIFERETEM